MFKKGCPINQRSAVSGADRKKLRRALQQHFPALDDAAADQLLPNKAGDMELAKVPAPSRTCIYLHDKVPIVVDMSGKGDLFPTVLGLWRAPGMLSRVYVKHPFVTTYLVNGADLMLPGVDIAFEFPAFQKGDLLAVCVKGNEAPVAVGVAGMSSSDAVAKAAQGLKGKLVEVLQVYGDYLWSELGGRMAPNSGFLANAVVPVGSGLEVLSGDESDEGDEQAGGEQEQAAAEGSSDQTGAAVAGAALQGLSLASGAAEAVAGSPVPEQAPVAPSTSSRPIPEDMNELLEMTLLQALARAVKDGDLPLSGSSLWANYMLPCRPAGSTLDVKKSKHKKMSKFLSAYGGRGELLTLKEDKHSGDMLVTAIKRDHPLLADFRPLPNYATAGGAAAGATAGPNGSDSGGAGPGAAAAAGASGATAGGGELVIQELWRAGKELRGVLDALGIRSDAMFSEKEAGEIAFQYVKHAQLDVNTPDPRTILLDATLCDALFKGLVKRGEAYPTHLAKADLRECFLRRCQAQCVISRGDAQLVKKGQRPLLSVLQKKKQGHRVTLISGMESFLLDPQELASACQKKFATSTTVNELPGKNQGFEVEIQGHIEALADFISRTYGIPKSYMKAD